MSNPNELNAEQIEDMRERVVRYGFAVGNSEFDALCDLALRALQDQKHHPMSSQDNPSSGEWIPCSERMPDDGALVMVWNGEMCTVATYDADPDVEPEDRFIDRMDGCGDLGDADVTHWMPLPKPPSPKN